MSGVVLQTVPLGFQWPTVDPFLFCVHHVDHYPAGNAALGPAAELSGRDLGADFAGVDGWRMYHGLVVPGFPQHPHRGFETVTYVRRGFIDHADSLGATARYGAGDTQWLTAGAGIQHAEMFPLLDEGAPNPVELFQIWLNLPAADKFADPHFTMFWSEETPVLAGEGAEVTVIAGALGDARPLPPPPRSWAARAESDVAIWHVRLDAGAGWTMPAAASEVIRTIYVFAGEHLGIAGHDVGPSVGAVVRSDVDVALTTTTGVECLVLQGRPIGEPVSQHGPFVMNDAEGIRQAFEDYRRTQFGGWPWPVADPVHARDAGRFARHADGRVEQAGAVPAR
jgi:quercetin 2,3-dioxygenase